MSKKVPQLAGRSKSGRVVDDDKMGLERLVFFSDAVFAIAITLLALEIRLPAIEESATSEQLLQSILAIWPKILGYVISFLVVGSFWLGHHRRFRFIERYDGSLMVLNLLLLMVVGFVPFPTSVLSEYGNRTATIFYAGVMTLLGVLLWAIWDYASRDNRLVDPQLSLQQRRHETARGLVVPAVFLFSIPLAFINDDLAKYSWILIAVLSKFIG